MLYVNVFLQMYIHMYYCDLVNMHMYYCDLVTMHMYYCDLVTMHMYYCDLVTMHMYYYCDYLTMYMQHINHTYICTIGGRRGPEGLKPKGINVFPHIVVI